jgi:two-component system, sensor histidine kinase and response regulator
VLQDISKVLNLQAREKGLVLTVNISPDVPGEIIGDAGRLRQVLYNLVENAIKFTPSGGIEVAVELVAGATEDVCLQFSVSDTGIGIPTDKHELVFQPFSQADGSMTRNYGGTGLGLTISARLAQLMKGKIWVESEPGKGSTFYFRAHFGVPSREIASTQNQAVAVTD